MPVLQDPRELPVRQVFSALKDRWLSVEDGLHLGSRGKRDNVSLTSFLAEKTQIPFTVQQVSQWSTGSQKRRISPSAVYALMADLGYEVVLSADGSARLVRVRP